METINLISGLVGVVLTILTFLGFQFGKRYMFRKEVVFGEQADIRYEHTKKAIHTGVVLGPQPYAGGDGKKPHQFEIASFKYDKETTPPEWKGLTKKITYYGKDDQGGITEHIWIVK